MPFPRPSFSSVARLFARPSSVIAVAVRANIAESGQSSLARTIFTSILCLYACASCSAQVNVTTYHYDNTRSGANTQETILTPSNVKPASFGKLFSVSLDAQVYAEPLVMTNVSIAGGTHNVVYVVTEVDTLYAIDADNGTVYWQDGFTNGYTPVPDGYTFADDENAGGSGVLSSQPTSQTPEKFNWPGPNPTVSSNGTSNGILWAVDASSYASRCCEVLHAYDATNLGNELFNTNQTGCGPVNNNQLGGAIKFSVPTVVNGKVYVGDASQLSVFGVYGSLTTASVSPTSLTLLSQYDNPAYGTATVTNTGPVELCFSSIGVSGDLMSLYSTTCGALSPGSSCKATVEYDPGGCYPTVSGELDFNDNTSSGGQSVSLTGKTGKCTLKPSP